MICEKFRQSCKFGVIVVFIVAILFAGCRKKAQSAAEPNSGSAAETSQLKSEQSRYANDLERLNVLTERINLACRGSFVVVLGGEGKPTVSNTVSVDYVLFDRLSDDGAAAMIAGAIAAATQQQPASLNQSQIEIQKRLLLNDETAGRYIAKGGFNPDGFREWLNARKSISPEGQSISEKMRMDAFMRGYLSVGNENKVVGSSSVGSRSE